jgi:integrase
MIARGAGITANRVHTALNALFHFANRKDIIESSPMAGVEKPVAEESRDRVLDDRELAKLWNELDKVPAPVAPFVRFLTLTGARRSEVADLTWSEIDTAKAEWLLPASRSKNRQEKLLPLSPEALTVLATIPHGSEGDHVFSYSGGKRGLTQFNMMKRKLDDAVGVTGWTLHDLRRTASTTMHRLGFQPHVVEATLGHRHSVGVAKTYNRWEFFPEKKMALDAWARFIVDNAGEKKSNVIALASGRGRA